MNDAIYFNTRTEANKASKSLTRNGITHSYGKGYVAGALLYKLEAHRGQNEHGAVDAAYAAAELAARA